MKRKYTILAFLVFIIAFDFSIWRINQPVVLENEEVERILKPSGEVLIKDGNFIIPVKNSASDKIIAKFVLVIEIKQEGNEPIFSSLISREIWKGYETKEIVVSASSIALSLANDHTISLNFRHATSDEFSEQRTCWISPCL